MRAVCLTAWGMQPTLYPWEERNLDPLEEAMAHYDLLLLEDGWMLYEPVIWWKDE